MGVCAQGVSCNDVLEEWLRQWTMSWECVVEGVVEGCARMLSWEHVLGGCRGSMCSEGVVHWCPRGGLNTLDYVVGLCRGSMCSEGVVGVCAQMVSWDVVEWCGDMFYEYTHVYRN